MTIGQKEKQNQYGKGEKKINATKNKSNTHSHTNASTNAQKKAAGQADGGEQCVNSWA